MHCEIRLYYLRDPLRLCASFLVCLALSIAARGEGKSETLRKAAEYLWSQQADDGGWHSQQYAVLRSGQALTPFVLHTLLQVPESVCPRPEEGARRALDFIRKHVGEDGALGHADPDIAEYPVYSTAYALMCLDEAGSEEDASLRKSMVLFLRSAQFHETNGFDHSHPAFGGWGFDAPLQPGQPGHMDLAHTRRALQALANCPPCVAVMSTVRSNAQEFLQVVQKHPDAFARQPFIKGLRPVSGKPSFDGGFYFSPVVTSANKGREEIKKTKYYRSYATATCDGILALLAAGVPRDDERLEKAVAWLEMHDDLAYPQGVPSDHPEPWGEAIRFYHYAARAEAYAALNWSGDWRADLSRLVAKQQAADGSFRNDASPLMKEDERILCSALATIALTHCAAEASD